VRLGCNGMRTHGQMSRSCFNEAEARAPRMPAEAVETEMAQLLASMRPRRVRLGCAVSVSVAVAAAVGFNEAEARAPRMPRGKNLRGRGINTCFNEAEARAPRMRSNSRIARATSALLQ